MPVPAHDGMERAQASAGGGGLAHRAERELLDRGRVAARRSERAAESAGARAGTGDRAKAIRGRTGGVCVARNGQWVRQLEGDVEIFDLEEEGSPCQLPGPGWARNMHAIRFVGIGVATSITSFVTFHSKPILRSQQYHKIGFRIATQQHLSGETMPNTNTAIITLNAHSSRTNTFRGGSWAWAQA